MTRTFLSFVNFHILDGEQARRRSAHLGLGIHDPDGRVHAEAHGERVAGAASQQARPPHEGSTESQAGGTLEQRGLAAVLELRFEVRHGYLAMIVWLNAIISPWKLNRYQGYFILEQTI